jgi:cytochrome c oxidase subunit 3
LSPSLDAPPRVAHHFANLEQQRDAHTLAMWIFLASEVLFFGGLFTAYAAMRYLNPSGFRLGSQHLSDGLGAINTAVLLTSSFTMAMGVWAAQTRQRGLLLCFLGATMLFGSIFLGIKGYEWSHEYHESLLPGPNFKARAPGPAGHGGSPEETAAPVEVTGNDARGMQMFFVFYFTITGLHALHMLIGLAVMSIQVLLIVRSSHFGIADYTPVELLGLYWHFVDIVWIFVFPLLYLLRH